MILAPRSSGALLAAAAIVAAPAVSQDLEQRVNALEQEIERLQVGNVFGTFDGDAGVHGLGPAASKVYSADGLSIGGYGEFHYEQISGAPDRYDALRGIIYVGYKFDDKWLVNTEIEFEHGTTDASSGTTSSRGSASLEFGYIDHLYDEALNFRAGLVLVPLGWINELHEPITFYSAARPVTEQRIIPSTWRSTGAGIFGERGGFSYRAYAVSSLNGEDFTSNGLRGGRQKGNRSASDDFAFAGRLDWVDTPGLTVGGGLYFGDTGQDGIDTMGNRVPAMRTTILDAHVEYETSGFAFRGLFVTALVDDAGTFNANTGNNLAERMDGWYVEGAYDLMAAIDPESGESLSPYIRYEQVDTQAEMPTGFVADPTKDEEIITFGINYKPIDQVVVKVDYQAFDQGDDIFSVLFGYTF